jgi:hypothetical protein
MIIRKRIPKKLSRVEIITLKMRRDIFVSDTHRYFVYVVNNEEGD